MAKTNIQTKGGGKLAAEEVRRIFAEEGWKTRFPPVLTLAQAAELAGVPLKTIEDWRYRGLMNMCSARRGKRVRVLRDRFLELLFEKLGEEGGRYDANG